MPRSRKNISSIIEAVEEEVVNDVPEDLKAEITKLSEESNGKSITDSLIDSMENSLQEMEAEFERIDQRAELAIQVVMQSIRTQAVVAKGQMLLKMRDKFSTVPGFDKSIKAFSERLGIPGRTLTDWMATATAFDKHKNVLGTDFLLDQSATGLATLSTLPEKVQDALVQDAIEDGELANSKELREIAKEPSVKLMKAEEKLEEAIEKVEKAEADYSLAQSDETISSTSEEYKFLRSAYHNSKNSVDNLNEQIAQLKSELVGEKAKADSARKAQEKLNEEMENLKFDDESQREQRIKRIQSTLTISIPQVLSDLMRYVAEEEYYQTDYKKAIREQMSQLKAFLGEHV